MTNSADSDQLASSLFAKTGHIVLSKRRVKVQSKFVVEDIFKIDFKQMIHMKCQVLFSQKNKKN